MLKSNTMTGIVIIYYGNNTIEKGKASDCIKCGKCEKNCPQNLKVRNHLEDVASVFEI